MKVQILSLFFALNLTQTALAIEEAEVKAPQKIKISSESTEITPLSSSKRHNSDFDERFSSSLDLRQRKRLAIGLHGMGKVGLLGASVDLNLNGENSAGGFVGGGPGFNTFGFGWKRYFGGTNFAPFVSVYFGRWYNASEKSKNISSTTPSYLSNTLLNAEEKSSGKYGLNILAPSFGAQYYFLDGDWKNSSLLAEIVMLRALDRSSHVVTASFGYAYTF